MKNCVTWFTFTWCCLTQHIHIDSKPWLTWSQNHIRGAIILQSNRDEPYGVNFCLPWKSSSGCVHKQTMSLTATDWYSIIFDCDGEAVWLKKMLCNQGANCSFGTISRALIDYTQLTWPLSQFYGGSRHWGRSQSFNVSKALKPLNDRTSIDEALSMMSCHTVCLPT